MNSVFKTRSTIGVSANTMCTVGRALTDTGRSVSTLAGMLNLSRSTVNRSLLELEFHQCATRRRGRHPTALFNYARSQPIYLWKRGNSVIVHLK